MSNLSLSAVRLPSHKLALALGLLLLVGAVPYALSSAVLLATPRDAAQRLAQYELSLKLFPSAAVAADLAVLHMAQARAGQEGWQASEAALRHSLALRPQDPLGWARLAYVLGEAYKPDEVGAALALSIASGPYIPGFMQWRLLIGLKYWPYFTEGQRRQVAGQAQRLWHDKPNDFIRLARMPALASQIEMIMQTYCPSEVSDFLQRRRPLRHTR